MKGPKINRKLKGVSSDDFLENQTQREKDYAYHALNASENCITGSRTSRSHGDLSRERER